MCAALSGTERIVRRERVFTVDGRPSAAAAGWLFHVSWKNLPVIEMKLTVLILHPHVDVKDLDVLDIYDASVTSGQPKVWICAPQNVSILYYLNLN